MTEQKVFREKAATEREQSDTCINSAKCEQARLRAMEFDGYVKEYE